MATKLPPETPIERIFREVMSRTMPQSIKGVLLQKESLPNILDYPGSMSQREKEGRAAEARLGAHSKGKRNRRRKSRTQ